jgi:hypothetical protein
LGATGERTALNRGESHAPIRSRSTVSVGGGDTTLGSQPSADIGNVSQPPPAESATTTGRPHHPDENDIEFGNVPRELGQRVGLRERRSDDDHPVVLRDGAKSVEVCLIYRKR